MNWMFNLKTNRVESLLMSTLPDGSMLNALLVREGYAQVMTVSPNVKYQDIFLKLQREAREQGRGLWGNSKN